jgi:hypothetical protein
MLKMNKIESLQQQVQELQLRKDVCKQEVELKRESRQLKQDLRDMGVLFDFQKFMFTGAMMIGLGCSYLCFLGSKFLDYIDFLCEKDEKVEIVTIKKTISRA